MSGWHRPNTAAPPKSCDPERTGCEKILTIKCAVCDAVRMPKTRAETAAASGRTVWRRPGFCRDTIHRTPSGMGADHPDRGRGDAVADPCRVAARPRRDDRQEAGLSQRRLQRHHARQPLLPGGKRLHPDLRPDAQRQSGAWLALSVRRLHRLRHQHLDRLMGARLYRRVRRGGAGRRSSCKSSSSAAWRARICVRPWSRSGSPSCSRT